MVPKLPGSRISSSATISPLLSIALGFGILKIAKALLGVVKKLIRFKSCSDIKNSSLALILNVCVVYKA